MGHGRHPVELHNKTPSMHGRATLGRSGCQPQVEFVPLPEDPPPGNRFP